ncbi:MAG: hypothetical protein IPH76_09820 [Xanthomonadales bacterium]|nr:hypothetical protein [Xanthomonadales bacterium]
MNRPLRSLLLAAAIALALPVTAPRAEPFTFQGFLEQAGTPLNGSANLAFKLYDAQSAGSQIGSTLTANAWPVAAGVFSIDLDFTGVVFTGAQRWLQVEVNGTPLAGRIAVQPAPLAASANALRGFNVLGSTPSSGQVLKWNGAAWAPAAESGGSSYSAGNGLTLSGSTFSVNFAGSGAANTVSRSDHGHFGAAWVGAAAAGLTVTNSSADMASSAILGRHTGSANAGTGVYGESTNPTSGVGVYGKGMRGVWGDSETPGDGAGVYGWRQVAGGAGVWGHSTGGETAVGVFGQTVSNGADAIVGLSSSTGSGDGVGVRGQSWNTSGAGVLGEAFAATGATVGVQGTSGSPTGVGVQGRALHASGLVSGVRGETTSSLGSGVQGNNTSTSGGSGVYGLSVAALGRGVLGVNQATTGAATGVYGQTASVGGYGVVGSNTGSGVGVRGEGETGVVAQGQSLGLDGAASDSAGQAIGVRGSTGSPDGAGVFAINSSATGNAYAAYAQTNSMAGTALVGDALATSGNNIGVLARTASGSGTGLRAENSATSGTGSGNALVAVGNLPSGDTLVVQANGTSSAWAIRATSAGSQVINAELASTTTSGSTISAIANTATGRAGYFQNAAGQAAQFVGNVDVSGTLSKGGGSFKIDHPLDPANKFLLHSFVESPDMMNVYNGNIVTDARGYASIDLPDWFEALNRDFRYQLTVIGSFARAMVAEEVQGNRFAIRTETPNTKVSWQVTGIRKDAWAEKHRIPVELQKAPAERGKYLHPELYGAPAGKRLGVESAKDAPRLAPTKSAAAPGKLP